MAVEAAMGINHTPDGAFRWASSKVTPARDSLGPAVRTAGS